MSELELFHKLIDAKHVHTMIDFHGDEMCPFGFLLGFSRDVNMKNASFPIQWGCIP